MLTQFMMKFAVFSGNVSYIDSLFLFFYELSNALK